MSFFRRRTVVTLILAAPLCEGLVLGYRAILAPYYKPLAWSQDGQFLVCNYGTEESDGTVVILPRNGGREVVLHTNTGSLACSRASFSPNGRKIAFEHLGVYIVDTDGKNKREVAEGELKGWSPDGSEVIVEDLSGKRFEVNIQTGKRHPYSSPRMVNTPQMNHRFTPLRLPNGDLVIPGWNTRRQEEIWRVHGDTGKGDFLVRGHYPLVSPQGDCIAYSYNGTIRFLSL